MNDDFDAATRELADAAGRVLCAEPLTISEAVRELSDCLAVWRAADDERRIRRAVQMAAAPTAAPRRPRTLARAMAALRARLAG